MKRTTATATVAYLATIPAANWLIGNVGTQYEPHGPHTIPVGFGLAAPSGVLMIGVALVLRDYVHERAGAWVVLGAIVAGAVLSLAVADPFLALASALAFGLGELADLAVYTPLRRRNLPVAVLASGAVGAVIDSAVFLQVAFGSTDFLAGNVVGKAWCPLVAAAGVWAWKGRTRP